MNDKWPHKNFYTQFPPSIPTLNDQQIRLRFKFSLQNTEWSWWTWNVRGTYINRPPEIQPWISANEHPHKLFCYTYASTEAQGIEEGKNKCEWKQQKNLLVFIKSDLLLTISWMFLRLHNEMATTSSGRKGRVSWAPPSQCELARSVTWWAWPLLMAQPLGWFG